MLTYERIKAESDYTEALCAAATKAFAEGELAKGFVYMDEVDRLRRRHLV